MSNRVDPTLMTELKKFGKAEWNECFHCGNCTAVCPLTEEGFMFPRKGIRALQLGLKQKIIKSTEPWLCYYCGECSETCPRDANPGELMMTLRRYLTAAYDWTGLSRRFYTSKLWELGAIGILAAVVVILFAVFLPPSQALFTNPEVFINEQGGVMINSMVDGISDLQFVRIIEMGDWTMAVIVGLLLITNIFNMWYKVIFSDKEVKVPFFAYIKELWNIIVHFATQPRFAKCDDKKYWLGHFLLMSGYTIMFIMIVGLLPAFQIEEIKPWYNWQRLLGYYATFGLLFFLLIVIVKRLMRKDIKLRFSHFSDWMFIILLFLTTVTGILVHYFRVNGMPAATYFIYVAHLAVLFPMIVIEVPFSKWAHLAYRPFAIYFSKLKKTAYNKQEKVDLRKAA